MAITKLVISGADSKTISLAHKAEATSVVPDDNITATNVQSALEQLDDIKAPKASPTFTGNVTASSLAVDTALDVTGTITCDSFNVSDGTETTSIPATADRISFSGATFNYIQSSTNLQVQPQGDLVLFGTGTEIMRLKSGKVGIGTGSPDSVLTIDKDVSTAYDSSSDSAQRSNTNTLLLKNEDGTANSFAQIAFDLGLSDQPIARIAGINTGASSSALAFVVEGSNVKREAMRIDSSGNLGIGTTNPAESLHTTGNIRLGDTSPAELYSNTNELRLGVDKNNDNVESNITFYTNNDEKIRIDKDGNLLVGKTAVSTINTVGFEAQNNGLLIATRDGNRTAILNRLTDDGNIIDFHKDGSPVGSIGVESNGRPYFANSVADGLKISNDSVAPCNGTGGNKDNAIDLGYSSNRWKDLYLSGGVHLGGTGSANKLDDYEEGTWTPAVIGSTSGSAPSSALQSNYTKIGNVVYFQCYLQAVRFDIHNIVGEVHIDGLPFAPVSFGMVQIGYTSMTIYDETQYQISGYTSNNQNRVILRRGSSNFAINHSHLAPNVTDIMVSGVYTTNA